MDILKKSRLPRLAQHLQQIIVHVVNLPHMYSSLTELRREFLSTNHEAKAAFKEINELKRDFAIKQRVESLDERVTDLLYQLSMVNQALADKLKTKGTTVKADTTTLMANDRTLDNFYIHFEKWFRGSEAEIKKRQAIYLPYFEKSKIDSKKFPIVDIGCGNGEFLQLMQQNDYQAIGLDLNKAMIKNVKAKGLQAVQNDAYSYLHQQKTGSLMAITGFHIVEHIPFAQLLAIFNECYRTLKPGGFVIFETPNPENLIVATNDFYHDPSHLKPLPPELLKIAIKSRGFSKTEVKRIFPIKNVTHPDAVVEEIAKRMYGPQNYAVIAWK